MTRQQKRKKIRNLEKEQKRIINNRQFQRILRSSEFAGLCQKDLDLLKKKEHTNKQLQAQFNFECVLIARLNELKQQIMELRLSPNE